MTPFRAELFVCGRRLGVVEGSLFRSHDSPVQLIGDVRCEEFEPATLIDFRLVLESGIAFDATASDDDGAWVKFTSFGMIEEGPRGVE
jgi:hypothetical protein